MTTIKVTPEQLLAVSRQFEAAQNQIYQMNNNLKQRMSEIERAWDGSAKENFYADFTHAQRVMDNFVTLSMSISKELRSHSEKFRMADSQTVQFYDPRCAPPPPDECRAPTADTRNAFQKSADSLAELGQAFMQSADDRYQKRYDSVGGFLDYWTFGIPSGLVQGYVERANKAFDSPNDTANWLTFGIHGTIREATFPTNAWSSEHWANIFGVGGLMLGGGYASTMIKPHNLFTSSGGGAKINSFSRPGTGNMTGGFHGFQDQRLRVTENIAESKKARESSNFSEFVEKEKEIVKETGVAKLPSKTIDELYEKTQNIRSDINRKVDEIRNSEEYNNLSNTQRKKLDRKLDNLTFGNVAVAEVNIKGIKKEFQAHSQIHSLDSVGGDFGDFTYSKEKKLFETYVVDEFPRFNDTEAKILEDIASQIKDPKVSGQIELFTELDACQSCSNLILEFRRYFPNIELNVNSKNMR